MKTMRICKTDCAVKRIGIAPRDAIEEGLELIPHGAETGEQGRGGDRAR
jgi:hypothetical protein